MMFFLSLVLRAKKAVLILCAAVLFTPFAHAGLFSDDEARRALIELRAQLEVNQQDLDKKIDLLQKSQFELANQIETLKQENASLRGQVEVLMNQVDTQQKQQKDLYQDVDSRLGKLEPKLANNPVNTNAANTPAVANKEQAVFDNALALFNKSNYRLAVQAFLSFLKTYPNSDNTAVAYYWLGSSYYVLADYKNTVNALQKLLDQAPAFEHAPDAMLTIANSQVELKQRTAARKTLDTLILQYPESQAAQTAQDLVKNWK